MNAPAPHFYAAPIVAISIALGISATASEATPRDELLEVLEQVVLQSDKDHGSLKVWVNDGKSMPLEVGTSIAFHFESKEDVHLTAMYLEAYGRLILLYPAPDGTLLRGSEPLNLEVGDATTPFGLESLFVVASREPISRELLGIASADEFAELEHDNAVTAAKKLQEIVAQGGGTGNLGARVDLHIVPARPTGQGYTRSGIIQYFTQAVRSIHRPKLALDIKFEFDSAGLREDARADLDVVGSALADERLSERRFMLIGHTDHQGDDDYNMTLSKSRAEAARNYLVEQYEIDPDRLEPTGMGESEPIAEGRDAQAMMRNRRVELKLIP
jgi:outer membrane protein OmpA-like peptidoglycan-associated protein